MQVKRILKIVGITLASAVVLFMLLAGIVIWYVFTPERLTPLVRQQAANAIVCKHEIGDVEMTFFSTFPKFGLKINGLTLVNPISGAQNDTLAAIGKMVASIDLQQLWNNNVVQLDEIYIDNLTANVFVDSAGIANYNVFKSESPASATPDTAAFSLPFKSLELSKIVVSNGAISYIDKTMGMSLALLSCNATLKGGMAKTVFSADINLASPDVSFCKDGTWYLKNVDIKADAPISLDMSGLKISMGKSDVRVNGIPAVAKGWIAMPDNGDIDMDLYIDLKKTPLKPLLALVPDDYKPMLKDIDADGVSDINVRVSGVYNDSMMPLVDVDVAMENGKLKYSGLPYNFSDLVGSVALHVDLNDSLASFVRINDLQVKTGETALKAKGTVAQLMADMQCELDLQGRIKLAEFSPMLPKDLKMTVSGVANGNAQAKFSMSQVQKMDLGKMNIAGAFKLDNFAVTYDTLWAAADKADLNFRLPNTNIGNKTLGFLLANIKGNHLEVKQGVGMAANIKGTDLKLQTSDLLKDKISVDCDFAVESASASMQNMSGTLTKPSGKLLLQMDMKDTLALPTVQCSFDMQHFEGKMDTIAIKMDLPNGKLAMCGVGPAKDEMQVQLDYRNSALNLNMGKSLGLDTKKLALSVKATHDSSKKDMLLQWNPKVSVSMREGHIVVANLQEQVSVPELVFDYNNEKFLINDSRFVLGASDFQLKGEVRNIGEWMNDTGLLTGELDFVSNVTDVNQLMNMTSGFGGDKKAVETHAQAAANAATTAEPDPFMVPKGVDITLNTDIKKALIGEQIATKLGGKLYVKDGVLVLEEMGFISAAARLQLTAMYRSPRPNHLYVGLDYHMLDIHIEELLKMLPDIDTIMPMLRSFKGQAEFHIAAETYMDGNYNLKKSTIRGASSVQGQNLVLMDGETFSMIAKNLMFNKKSENKVDSLSAEFALFKNEVDVYPFKLKMDKYEAVIGGRHNLDMSFDYHISLLKPLRIGLNVGGTLDDMKYRLAACKYVDSYLPFTRKVVDRQKLELRQMIRESLTQTVKK